jgi:hypothetical protein
MGGIVTARGRSRPVMASTRGDACRCTPTSVATFRAGELVSVVRRHHNDRCGLATEYLDLADWRAALPVMSPYQLERYRRQYERDFGRRPGDSARRGGHDPDHEVE